MHTVNSWFEGFFLLDSKANLLNKSILVTQSSVKIWHWNILFTDLRYKNLTGLEKVRILRTVSEWVQLCVNKMAKIIIFFSFCTDLGNWFESDLESDLEKVQLYVNKMANIKCLFFILHWLG